MCVVVRICIHKVCEVVGIESQSKGIATMTEPEKYTALFGSLVLMFQTAAMQQMGKVKNSVTDKIERDLDQAQLSIDMLDMLEAKTRGNLTDEEKKYLGEVLKELKLNYVDEKAKDKPDEKATNKPDEKESK